MPTFAILFLSSQTWQGTAVQVLVVCAALGLGVLLSWQLLNWVQRIYQASWTFAQAHRTVCLQNTGNVIGVFRLHAFNLQNALAFRFIYNKNELPLAGAVPAEDIQSADMQPDLDQYSVETPQVPPGEQLPLELLIETRKLFCGSDYRYCVRAFQVEQPGHPLPEQQRETSIDQEINLSQIARWHRALKALFAASAILIWIGVLVALAMVTKMLVLIAGRL